MLNWNDKINMFINGSFSQALNYQFKVLSISLLQDSQGEFNENKNDKSDKLSFEKKIRGKSLNYCTIDPELSSIEI